MKKVLALAVVAGVFAVTVGCGGATSATTKTVSTSTTVSSATTPR